MGQRFSQGVLLGTATTSRCWDICGLEYLVLIILLQLA